MLEYERLKIRAFQQLENAKAALKRGDRLYSIRYLNRAGDTRRTAASRYYVLECRK